MHLITAALPASDSNFPEVGLTAERLVLAKRRWRGIADDGTEFGFELNAPLKHGDLFFESALRRYVIRQQPEPLLEISLDITPSAAAGIGWAVGNLHLELSAEATRLLAPDEPAVRQLLTRISVPFQATTGIFRPGRFARGPQTPQELGASHRH